jgi:hypothetical protein
MNPRSSRALKSPRKLYRYFQANARVPGLNSPMRKVSIALTLIQGPKVATWVRDMGAWIDSLDPIDDNIQFT